MSDQPLVSAAAISSLVSAIIALLVSFGVPVTPEQNTAIMTFVAALIPWLMWFLAKNKVTALADPKDEDGQPLTRAGDLPTLKQQRKGSPK